MPERLRKNLRLEGHAAHHGSSILAKVAVRRAKASADRSNYSETDRARRAVEVSARYPQASASTRGSPSRNKHYADRPYTPLVSVTSIGLTLLVLAYRCRVARPR